MAEIFDWLKPMPFWEPGTGENGEELIRPALLEFDSDRFMDEFLAETTSGRDADWQKLKQRILVPPGKTLRLYQPAHGRYYLLCASLCCRQPGFPDREVRRAEGENISFVLRKVSKGQEFGWSVAGPTKSWRPVDGKLLVPDEERLPLFATFSDRGRSVVYGYVPVASRDTYRQDVPVDEPDANDELRRIVAQFDENIGRPLGQFATSGAGLKEAVKEEMSLFLLSDLADYLDSYLRPVHDAIRDKHPITAASPAKDLYDLLKQAQVREIDATAEHDKTAVEALEKVIPLQQAIQDLNGDEALPLRLRIVPSASWVPDLRSKVMAALSPPAANPAPETRATPIPKLTAQEGDTFLLRCVYERPCDAPFPPRLRVSGPTHAFEMATFFDTEAPARPIRIEMPADVSIAAMRKFRKGVGFMLSNAMRNKMEMVLGNERELLKDGNPGSEGTWSLGILCSFSIQIIFICAFFLLLIIVFVLNIVFWWLPFFRICLPIPKKGT